MTEGGAFSNVARSSIILFFTLSHSCWFGVSSPPLSASRKHDSRRCADMILSPAAKSDGSVSNFDISTLAIRPIAAAYHRWIQACRLSGRRGSPKYTARLDRLCTVLRTNAGMSYRCDQHLPLHGGRSLMSVSNPSRRSRLIAGTVCMR
jgi:hypothetical protein